MKSGTTSKTDRYTTIPNHPGDMPEGTLRAILKQAGVEPEDFLSKKYSFGQHGFSSCHPRNRHPIFVPDGVTHTPLSRNGFLQLKSWIVERTPACGSITLDAGYIGG